MVDVGADLSSLSFDAGLTEDERQLIHLRARSAALTFCGCAHAVYLCKLVQSLRCVITANTDSDLCVGILGMGHMGRKLLLSLLEKSDIKPSHIKISSKRPENAGVLFCMEVYDHQPHDQMSLLEAMDAGCRDITVDDCQGWMRHSKRFYPRCIALDNIRCDVDENMWPNPEDRRD